MKNNNLVQNQFHLGKIRSNCAKQHNIYQVGLPCRATTNEKPSFDEIEEGFRNQTP